MRFRKAVLSAFFFSRIAGIDVSPACEESRARNLSKVHIAICLVGPARTFQNPTVHKTLKRSVGGLSSGGAIVTIFPSIGLVHVGESVGEADGRSKADRVRRALLRCLLALDRV